jgi:hypothetical protein
MVWIQRLALATLLSLTVTVGDVFSQVSFMDSRHNTFQVFGGYGGDNDFAGVRFGLGATLAGRADITGGLSIESAEGTSLKSFIQRFEYLALVRYEGKSRIKLTVGQTWRHGFKKTLRVEGEPDNWSMFRFFGAGYLELPTGGRTFLQPGLSVGWASTSSEYADHGIWGEVNLSFFSRGSRSRQLWGLTGTVLFPIGFDSNARFGVHLTGGFLSKK